MTKLYYTPPQDKIFKEIKKESLKIWDSYDDTYGYATEKKDRIKDLENVGDNVMYMFAMFDLYNQKKLYNALSKDSQSAILLRLIDGGADPERLWNPNIPAGFDSDGNFVGY